MPKCPYCKSIAVNSIKEWSYGRNYFVVKEILCQHCGITFRAYYHDNKLSHTIPKMPSLTKRILRYLGLHQKATAEQIAEGLNEKLLEVESILKSLKQQGTVVH